jgi:3-hydroxybutyrate dehydrogenase
MWPASQNFPIERWDAVIAINLSSAFHTSRLVLPAMQKANWGRIDQRGIGSRLGGLGREGGLRCGGQARHCGFDQSDCFRKRHVGCGDRQRHLPRLGADASGAKTSGRQNGLGFVHVEATKLLLGEELSMQFTTPEELGELAVFFCSAAGNIGVAWNMDGGWAAQ